jgi:plasmid stabilization system protein ParE
MYRLVITDRATRKLQSTYSWLEQHRSPALAKRWYEKFVAAISTLPSQADRYAAISEKVDYPHVLREMHFGLGKTPTHRAIFAIVHNEVVVLTIRHVAEDVLTDQEI